jgi:hypothetical protein
VLFLPLGGAVAYSILLVDWGKNVLSLSLENSGYGSNIRELHKDGAGTMTIWAGRPYVGSALP